MCVCVCSLHGLYYTHTHTHTRTHVCAKLKSLSLSRKRGRNHCKFWIFAHSAHSADAECVRMSVCLHMCVCVYFCVCVCEKKGNRSADRHADQRDIRQLQNVQTDNDLTFLCKFFLQIHPTCTMYSCTECYKIITRYMRDQIKKGRKNILNICKKIE